MFKKEKIEKDISIKLSKKLQEMSEKHWKEFDALYGSPKKK